MRSRKSIEPTVEGEQKRTTRPKRVPLHEQRSKLTAYGIDEEKFAHRWVNDDGHRIQAFKAAGWEVAPKTVVGDAVVDSGESSTTSMNEKHVGRNIKAILMRIPREFYEEDQAAKQKQVDQSEAALRREALTNYSENRNPQFDVERRK